MIGSMIIGGVMIAVSLVLLILSWSQGDSSTRSYSLYGLLLGTICIAGAFWRKKRGQQGARQPELGQKEPGQQEPGQEDPGAESGRIPLDSRWKTILSVLLLVFLIVFSVYQLFSELSQGGTGGIYLIFACCGVAGLVKLWDKKGKPQ